MLILLFFGIALGRIHELDLVKDDRAIIDLSSFAYNNNGTLSLTFKEFRLEEDEIKKMVSDKARDLYFNQGFSGRRRPRRPSCVDLC